MLSKLSGHAVAEFYRAPQAGLDSLGAVELQNAVSRSLGVALPATVAFDYPTVAALAAYINTQQRPRTSGDEPSQEASPGADGLTCIPCSCTYGCGAYKVDACSCEQVP